MQLTSELMNAKQKQIKKTAVISGMERSRHLNYFYQKKKEKEVNIY